MMLQAHTRYHWGKLEGVQLTQQCQETRECLRESQGTNGPAAAKTFQDMGPSASVALRRWAKPAAGPAHRSRNPQGIAGTIQIHATVFVSRGVAF